MLYQIFKQIYKFLLLPFTLSGALRRRIFNFMLPNILVFIRKGISFSSYPDCIQKTLITGFGTVEIGVNCCFGFKLGGFFRKGFIEIQSRNHKSHIKIGDRVSTNNNVFLCAANWIEIGNDTLIGQYVTIMDFEAHGIPYNLRRETGEIGIVVLGKNVWIGNNVIILKNSIIGDNSIVAAGAVVTGTFPENVIIGGVPAKIIRQI